jgi:hypothetical protein
MANKHVWCILLQPELLLSELRFPSVGGDFSLRWRELVAIDDQRFHYRSLHSPPLEGLGVGIIHNPMMDFVQHLVQRTQKSNLWHRLRISAFINACQLFNMGLPTPKSPPVEGTLHAGAGNLLLLTTNDSIIVV